MELFFDLVYVFAFTQLSEHLYEAHSWKGALEVLVLFVALWWAWNYTAWATGWVDPERAAVVVMMALLMLGSLIMSAAIVRAFSTRGAGFALSYVSLQVGRGLFMIWAFSRGDKMRRNYIQLTVWSAIAGCIWIAGGIADNPDTRLELWVVAALVDTSAPIHGFWLPGFRHTPIRDWTLAGAHLAQRCQLVLMVAFGETFLRIGESFAGTRETTQVAIAFVIGCMLDFALWALYFFHHAVPGERRIGGSREEAARLGRSAYAYAHAVMVGAIVIVAVAVHLAIEAPTEHAYGAFAWICLGGPSLFLIGLALSKRWLGHGSAWPPVVGVLGLALFGAAGSFSNRLVELLAAMIVCGALAIWSAFEPGAGLSSEATVTPF